LDEEFGTAVEPEYTEHPIPDDVCVHDTCADYSKMQQATGWCPRRESSWSVGGNTYTLTSIYERVYKFMF